MDIIIFAWYMLLISYYYMSIYIYIGNNNYSNQAAGTDFSTIKLITGYSIYV